MNIKQIVDNMDVYAVKMDDTYSVLVKDRNSKFEAWMDVWISDRGDVNVDWNKYIFYLYNEDDVFQRDVQDYAEAFDMCCSVAIEYLENADVLVRNDDDTWAMNQKMEVL